MNLNHLLVHHKIINLDLLLSFFFNFILIISLIGLIIKAFTSDAKANLLLSPPDMPFIPCNGNPIKVSSHFLRLSFLFLD